MPIDTCSENISGHKNDVILRWTVHLAHEQPLKLAAAMIFIAIASVSGCIIIGPLAALIVGLVTIASLADFLFPIEHVITGDKAICRMLLKSSEIRWADVKRCYLDDMGVKLSPLERKSRLEAFRGVYLRFNNNSEQVIETIKALRNRHV